MIANFVAGVIVGGLFGWFGWNALMDTISAAKEREWAVAVSAGFLATVWLGVIAMIIVLFATTAPAAYAALFVMSAIAFVLVIERQSRIFVADTVWPIVQLVALVFGLLVGAVTMWRYFF